MSLILECPHCQSCFSAEDWNKSPHMGDDIPITLESSDDYDKWLLEGEVGRFDCPECGEVAIAEDITPV